MQAIKNYWAIMREICPLCKIERNHEESKVPIVQSPIVKIENV